MFLNLIEAFYPLNCMQIATLIVVRARIYSVITTAISMYFAKNSYYILAGVILFPFLYISVTYQTGFKRYRYYFNEKTKY